MMNMPSSTAREAAAFAASSPARSRSMGFADAAFVSFLLLIFVTLKPFAIRDMAVLPLGDSGTGAGDALRQLAYLTVFAALAIAAFQKNGTRMFVAMPALLVVLLSWCLVTCIWAPAPDVAMRRAGLEIVIAFSAMLGVQAIGPERSMLLLRNVLVAVLAVNFVSVAVVH